MVKTVFLAILPAVILVGLLAVFLWRCCCCRRKKKENQGGPISSSHPPFYNSSGIRGEFDSEKGIKPSFFIRSPALAKPLFSWYDNPRLVMEAVEHGWPRFAFNAPSSSSPSLPRSVSTTAALRSLCSAGQHRREGEAEMSWEVPMGSSEAIQKIQLRPGLGPAGVIRAVAALPLPGPPLGNSAFPQEAYLEVTILRSPDSEGRNPPALEGEKIKLVQNLHSKTQSDSLVHVNSTGLNKVEAVNEDSGLFICLGLTGPGSPPANLLPGTYPGSIGFYSNGSVHLDGINLVKEGNPEQNWAQGEKVIGCGFDPKRKKVVFTLDSRLVHEVYCRAEEFGTPMYPVVVATMEAEAAVNMGQEPFRYRPANSHRTPNPCFLGPAPEARDSGRDLGHDEDSSELFSMGRIDSHWRASRKGGAGGHYDEGLTVDSEDLFEIVLDDRGLPR